MIELAIVEVIQTAYGEMWSMIQWWASITVGLVALTHFASKKINLLSVIILSALYTLFSAYALINVRLLGAQTSGYREELRILAESGELTGGGLSVLEAMTGLSGPATVVFLLCGYGAFIGTLFHLTYTYWNQRGTPASMPKSTA